MKKLLSVILSMTMLLSMVVMVSAEKTEYSDSKYSVYLDGAYIDVKNITVNEVEYLPIKELCYVLGYDIEEISENTYEITEGKECKNSKGTVGRVEFTVGKDFYTSYSKNSNYKNTTKMFPTEPMTIKIGDEIYITSYYFGRMLEIKTRFTTDMKIALITVNNQVEQAENAPEYLGNIFVKNFDGVLRIELDGNEMTFTDKPFIDKDGRTQIPVREFCEKLGCNVSWLQDVRKVNVSTVTEDESKINGGAGGDNLSFTIGKRQYTINGTYYDMDTEARIVEDRTYVPLRYLAEALNYYVGYNPASGTVIDMGYGYSALNSYLGLKKEIVFDEMGIDESYSLKTGDEALPILQHQEGSMYIVKNGYKKGHVVLEFYNDVLCAFWYVFKTEGEAFDESLLIYDYLVKLHGTEATYPGTEKTIAKITPDESRINEDVCHYYDEWHINASDDLVEALLGDSDNALMKMLKMDINPQISTVRVILSRDVNYHNRSVLKIMDKDNNYIITDGDVLSCEVKWMPRPEDGPSAGIVTAVALELKITEKARKDFKEATKRISEYPYGENYVKVFVDGVEISKPTVSAEIDSDEILITSQNWHSDFETYKEYAEKINEAIK